MVRISLLFAIAVGIVDVPLAASDPAGRDSNRLTSTRPFSRSTVSRGPSTVDILVDRRWRTGLHLLDSQTESLVMGRDGVLHTVSLDRRESHMRVSERPFKAASAAEMRNQLRVEFGSGFEVVATQNFLVVQPKSRGRRWPNMFETSHRSFVDYMTRRGVSVRQGRFPMVAVVFPDSHAMYAEFQRLDLDVSRVSGLYANRCNRVMTHDGGQLESIIATVRHEAAHQSAFNTGVHSRVNDTPSWITEGIGQLFEPSAIASGHAGSHVGERVNHDSLNHLESKGFMQDPDLMRELVQRMILTDQLFDDRSTVHTAYSVAWAMMFYLAERDHDAMARMLNFTATRPPFSNYSRQQREIDFRRIVGVDPVVFANRLIKFLETLR
ncbi:MAG: DUF1570 domain-containing protein [Planctomycetota bacterium]